MMHEDLRQRLLQTPAASQWKKIGIKPHHGIDIPLFSLHSQTSCGIGEYPDLIPLISWCHAIGFDVIQLLPLNDTGIDNGPYAALSANALNPLHLGLSQLPFASDEPNMQQLLAELQRLNSLQRIDYADVHHGKDHFLREYYQRYASHFVNTPDYLDFKCKQPWLTSYALFKALKIQFQWQPWESWPEPWKKPTAAVYDTLPDELKSEVEFHSLVQYLCFSQLDAVRKHADQQGVFLKGDIPILLNRESADVWCHQDLFLLDFSAGAPPDMYSAAGQKWGFPLYNWETVKQHHYQWWIERLHTAECFYHLYRLDHIVGFFRIWAIPLPLPATEGAFFPADACAWLPQGEEIMRMMLANSTMLPIGEDLGVVPPEVRSLLQSLGICGTKVMRWERRWQTDQGFIPPKTYIAESMTTVSTHDSETLALWWRDQPAEASLFTIEQGGIYSPILSPEQRIDILRQSHTSGSLFHINLLQEYFPLVPGLTWDIPEDERINVPGTVSDRNWSYRFRPSVEEITASTALKEAITELLGVS